MMVVGPMEFILIFGAILLLFGPSKLPEIAKSIGEATRQYKKGMTEVKSDLQSGYDSSDTPLTEDEKLIKTAEKLGIPTKERSIEDIAQDIINHPE